MTRYVTFNDIDWLLADLTYKAQSYDMWRFGLPMGIPEAVQPLRDVVVTWLNDAQIIIDEIELVEEYPNV